jgi:KaiC/GvpD/RAD55 family RecA-like ATPase
MVETDNLLKRVNTGIYGYDEMLNGGFFKQTVNVISGESGTGKTVLGSQFIYQAALNGEKALCIMTTESANSLKKEMYSSFKWDFWELEQKGMISFIDIADPELRLQKTIDMAPMELIKSFKKLITHKIEEYQPDRIFIDAVEALLLAIESPYKLKTLVDDLFSILRISDVTTMVSVGTTFEIESVVEYGADSVTRLGRVVSGNNLQRSIYVAKLRGSGTINEIRVLNISDSGIRVLDQSPYISTG